MIYPGFSLNSSTPKFAKRSHYRLPSTGTTSFKVLIFFYLQMMWLLILVMSGVAETVTQTCTDRYGLAPVETFSHRSCAMCYAFLFPQGKPLVPMGYNLDYLGPMPKMNNLLLNSSDTDSDTEGYSEITTPLHPDVENQTVTERICTTLNDDECKRWQSCCHSAQKCCRKQMDTLSAVPDGYCRRTWDGYSCWEDTPPNTYGYKICPAFIEHSLSERKYTTIYYK